MSGTSPPNGPFAQRHAVRRPGRRAGRISGSIARGMSKNAEQLVVPVERLEVHQHGAAGVGHVGDVHAAVGAAGEVPEQPGVGVAEDRVAALGRLADPVDVLEDPLDLAAGEVRRRRQPGLAPDRRRRGRRARARRRSGRCGCPARRSRCSSGRPVLRSHTTVVSRWLVMPTAARSAAARSGLARARSGSPTDVRSQISTGSCSTQPACGRICSCSSWWRPTSLPPWSKIMKRVLVVPWSMAPTKSAIAVLLLAGGRCAALFERSGQSARPAGYLFTSLVARPRLRRASSAALGADVGVAVRVDEAALVLLGVTRSSRRRRRRPRTRPCGRSARGALGDVLVVVTRPRARRRAVSSRRSTSSSSYSAHLGHSSASSLCRRSRTVADRRSGDERVGRPRRRERRR